MTYENLLKEADDKGLIVKEKNIPGYGGRIYRNRIAIHSGLDTSVEKACVLAEELGHHYTTVGNILDVSDSENCKQERQARLWAYNKLIGLHGIVKAFEHGCKDCHEIAEYLEVTEGFLQDCIECYRNKYGVYKTLDNYIIYFIPHLTVGERI